MRTLGQTLSLGLIVVAMLAPNASAAIVNNVVNGDFALGTLGWSSALSSSGFVPPMTRSCVPGGGDMAILADQPGSATIVQPLATPPAPNYKLDFWAQNFGPGTTFSGTNIIQLAQGWVPTGQANTLLRLEFTRGQVRIFTSFSTLTGTGLPPVAAIDMADSLCHHYEVYIMNAAVGSDVHAWLHVDGSVRAHAVGRDTVPAPTMIFVGDSGNPTAPTIAYDNIAFGAWV